MTHRTKRWLFPFLYLPLVYCPLHAVAQQSRTIALTTEERQFLARNNYFDLCVDPAFMPYEQINDRGEHEGLFADFISLIAQKSGIHFILKPTDDYPQAKRYFKQGLCDVISGDTVPVTKVDYLSTKSYFTADSAIAIHVNQPDHLDLYEIADRPVGYIEGADVSLLKKSYPGLSLVGVESDLAGIRKVATGELNAFVSTMASIDYTIKNHGITNVKLGGKVDDHVDFAMLVNRRFPLLVSILNKAIEGITAQERQAIVRRWFQPALDKQREYRRLSILLYALTAILAFLLFRYFFQVRRTRQLQRHLSNTEVRFRDLVENTHDWIWEVDADSRYTYVSPRIRDFLGYEPEEILGRSPFDLMPPGEAVRVRASFSKIIEERRSFNTLENINLHRDGREVVLESSGVPIFGSDGLFLGYRGSDRNVTERKEIQDKVRMLSQTIEQSPVSVMITDTEGNLIYVNGTFETTTGYTADEVLGRNSRLLEPEHTPATVYEEIWRSVKTGKSWQGELQTRKKNEEVFWEFGHFAPVLDPSNRITHFVAVKEDITLRKQQEEKILHQAHFDDLTGLPNRFLTLDRLSHLLNEALREEKRVAVLFIDLDDFKKINDSLGHETGDKLLVEASTRLSNLVRSVDTVGRLGGDEFLLLIGGLEAGADVLHIAEKIVYEFQKAFLIDGREMILTTSVGVAIFPDDGKGASELLSNADSAMYHAKELGRNTYSCFTESMNRKISRRISLEEQMHGALSRGEFAVYYQPKIDISTGAVAGAEALLRWHNSEMGDISPAEFIPIAEQTGIILPIGQFVLSEALRMAAQWRRDLAPDFHIAVNLSPRQFRDPGLVGRIESAMRAAQLTGECIEFEITEGVLMSRHAFVDEAIADLSSLGITLTMDDFGTGYSSLSYLRSYPFDTIKVERTFVKEIVVEKADRELVSAMVAMAHGLGLRVVAEGVETEEQLVCLRQIGCDFAQGYLFGRPMSAEKLASMLGPSREREINSG
jgi:diguanylate cyclase (GGDEF)-like protein/PAS domain S-box-containing protein